MCFGRAERTEFREPEDAGEAVASDDVRPDCLRIDTGIVAIGRLGGGLEVGLRRGTGGGVDDELEVPEEGDSENGAGAGAEGIRGGNGTRGAVADVGDVLVARRAEVGGTFGAERSVTY